MKKLNKFVIIFLILQPFLDIYAGINFPVKIHMFLRGLFFLICMFYLLKNKKELKIVLILTTIMFIYFISYLIFYNYSYFTSISYILKLFYLPITIIFFYNYKDDIDNKYFFLILLGYSILFILCYLLNLGSDVYESGVKKTGFKGLFNSINELSAIIILLLPIVLNYLQKNKKYISCIILSILISIISMLTGTKVILGGLIIVFLYFLYNPFTLFYKKQSMLKKIFIFIFITLSVSLSIFIITNTTAYKNALVQQNFFKVKNIFSLEGINKVIFNDRFSFIKDNHKRFSYAPFYQKIFGLKYSNTYKTVEIDLFDIFYMYGFIGIFIILSIIIYYLYKSKLKGVYLLDAILFLLISETSGHVLIYPAVSIYMGVIIYLNKRKTD